MKRFFRLIYSNKFFAFIMFVLQIAAFFLGYKWLNEYYIYIHSVTVVLCLLLSIHEINKTTEPGFKIVWIMLIAFIPIFGMLLYLFLHLLPVTNEIEKKYEAQRKIVSSYLEQDEETFAKLTKKHMLAPGLAKYLRMHSGSPVYENTAVKYYKIGDDALKAIIDDLKKAKDFIFLEFFIINQTSSVWKEIVDILKDKAKKGVEVRIMYDGMGCLNILPREYPSMLKKFGIKCKIFSPIMPLLSTYQNNRDHRKICVVDGKIAYTGGINLADEYANRIVRFGHWKDCAIRLEGEAVAGFTAMFLNIWDGDEDNQCDDYRYYIDKSEKSVKSDGFVIPFGDCPLDNVAVGKRVYLDNLNNAKKYAHIMSPYLVIDSEMYETMRYAAQRGVDVKIIMPHIPDKKYAFYLARSYYKELLEAGIQIYEYIPGFVHSKLSVADGERAVVGTINHDYRSLYLHYECAVYLLDVPQIEDIEYDFNETLKSCCKITPEIYKSYPLYQRIFGKFARILAPLI